MIERRLTKTQLNTIGQRIVDRFFARFEGTGQHFGLDWATMRVLFPRECRVFDRLKQAYRI
jgi:hypothetical protein